MKWTVQRVREELPEVPVTVQGVVCIGQVAGRCLPAARVYFTYLGDMFNAEWSWTAVARALNTGKPLLY